MIKLHLGCGNKKIPGFVNIDILETEATDLVLDLNLLKEQFEENSVDYIYTCHTLEHFSRHSYQWILDSIYHILKPGGMVRISVPDFEALVEYYSETKNLPEVRGTIFGGQRDRYDYHCWTWDFKNLSEDLMKSGFKSVKRYDPLEVFHIRDWSLDFVPRHDENGKELPDEVWFQGKLVSLNVEAVK